MIKRVPLGFGERIKRSKYMELSVMSPVLNQMNLEESLAYLSSLGVDSMEIGAGGFPLYSIKC